MRTRRNATFEHGAAAIAKGLLAGIAGTAAITASMSLASKLQGQEPGPLAAEAASKVLGVQPTTPEAKMRLSQLVHWAYGTGWGALLGLLVAAGLRLPAATAVEFGAIFGAELAMLPTLKLAPPVTKWPAKDTASSVFHHALYAAAAGLTYRFLEDRLA